MIIELQQHAEAVARQLKAMTAAETTQSLRGFTEDNFGVSGARFLFRLCLIQFFHSTESPAEDRPTGQLD